jgi:arylsulfatase A
MNAARAIITLLTLPILFLAALRPALAADELPPNLIVVFCDNLGYGDVEPFGGKLHRTPNLNRMAKEGRKFTHFCSTSGVCTPSRASLMTGCYSQRVGMHTNPRDGQVLRPVSPHGLHPNEVTIAEVLDERGYATTIIGKWHLGDQLDLLPTRQGFDSFFGVPYSDDMTHAVGQRLGERLDGHLWPALPLMDGETVIEAPVDRNGLTARYTNRALKFIETHQKEPFFLYMPQAMPGSTSEPFASPQFRGKSANGPWGDSIEELDWSLGQILDKLVELKIDRRTLVVWTSDNGAPLAREKGSTARGSNAPLFGRGYTTSEGGFRIPTIAWWPARIPAGTESSELATTMDLLPTMAKLSGGEIPQDRVIDGHDIRPLLFGEHGAKSPYKAFYYYQTTQLQAVRSGPWKLFMPLKPLGRHPHFGTQESKSPLLFNLVEDIASANNVAAAHPDVVARLTALAESARRDLGDVDRQGENVRACGTVENPTPRLLPAEQNEDPGSTPVDLSATRKYSAVEAIQAAAADVDHLYAIASRVIAKYDRRTGFRLAVSQGDALHLNSGFVWHGKLLSAHSNYPGIPERSEIKQLDPQTMQLTTYHDFEDFGGSLTWVVRRGSHWLCNFARYGDNNHETFLVLFDESWQEQRRWTYPKEVIEKWGNYSTSGGVWRAGRLWTTDHDHPRVDILRIPEDGDVLEYEKSIVVPFTGQGIAIDPVAGGLVGISRAQRQLIVAEESPPHADALPVRTLPRDDQLQIGLRDDGREQRATTPAEFAARRWRTLLDMQAIMGEFPGEPKRCPLNVKVIQEEDCGSYVRRFIEYQSEPGGAVTAYLLVPKRVLEDTRQRQAPAVLCLHPTDNKIGHKVVVGLGGRANRQYASELAELGFVTISPSYPLLADYQPDVKGLGWSSGTMKAIWDNVRAVDLLDSLPYVRKGKYGVIGHSLGGHNSVYTAAFDKRLAAVVSSCGLDSYPDYYGGDAKRWEPGQGWTQLRYIPALTEYRGRLDKIPFDFQEMISALAPRHVFISAPLHDSNFRAKSVDRVVAAAKPVFELWNAGDRLILEHPDCDHDFPDEMREQAYKLFEKTLGKPPS